MPAIRYKPTSAGRRNSSVLTRDSVTRNAPEKKLLAKMHKTGGRNNKGRITTRHIGGGHKRRYRLIDFKRTKDGVPATVASIEYDPNRSANIALLHYHDGEKRYILAPRNLTVGSIVMSGPDAEIDVGNTLPLNRIPVGTVVHAVELEPGRGAQMARSAGTSAQLTAREGQLRDAAVAERRAAARQGRVPGDRRRGRQPVAPERALGQGGQEAAPRHQADGARHGHEPRGPPARRRRGQEHAGPGAGHAVGQAHPRARRPGRSTSGRTP